MEIKYVQSKDELEPVVMSAHGGQGQITMWFYHSRHQNLDLKIGNEDSKNPANNSLWNFMALAHLPVGATVAEHLHSGNDEIFFIISGSADITIDNITSSLKTGDMVLTKSGSKHSITNVRKELRFIVFEVLVEESINNS